MFRTGLTPRVLICGSGAASQTLACVLSSRGVADVAVYSRTPARVTEWNRALESGYMLLVAMDAHGEQRLERARSFSVLGDPAEAARDRAIVIISVPAFLHAHYLELL